MVSQIEVEDYIIRKLQGMAITPNNTTPIPNKHLKGYVPDEGQLGITSNKLSGAIDQFTKVKYIHNGIVRYMRHGARNEQQGSVAVNKFQGHARKTYLVNLKRKDSMQFGTSEVGKDPLETIFRQIVFKPLVFVSFGEMSSNVVNMVETSVE